jgi:hypothetical protein
MNTPTVMCAVADSTDAVRTLVWREANMAELMAAL